MVVLLRAGMERPSAAMPHPNLLEQNPSIDEFIHSNSVNRWWKNKYKHKPILYRWMLWQFVCRSNQ
jgi:hypothetical protein